VDSVGRVLAKAPGRARIAVALGAWRDERDVSVVLRRPASDAAFTMTSAEYGRHCALTASGTAYCLDTADDDTVGSYVRLPGAGDITLTSLHAVTTHQCGLNPEGALFCWGINNVGQFLNNVNQPFRATAAPAPGGDGGRFISVAVGDSPSTGHTCAVRISDSVVVCAGYNSSRQLGRPTPPIQDSIAQPVSGNFRARSVATLRSSTCAIGIDSRAYCWGAGSVGGSGATPQPAPSSSPVSALSVGINHACAVSVSGQAACWGDNSSGQLGSTSVVVPPSSGPILTGLRFSSVLAGASFTCGVTVQGQVYCWGDYPPAVVSTRRGVHRSKPQAMFGSLRFVSISADANRLCGVATTGAVWCQ
jgi:alpha-tubulin suppressor-like RCC1 family protein